MTLARSAVMLALVLVVCSPGALADTNISCGGTDKADVPGFIPVHVIENPPPQFPRTSAGDLNEGWACLEYAVTPQGAVRDISVVDAMGSPAFVKSALDTVSKWRYAPATRGGNAVDQYLVRATVTFLMEGTGRLAEHESFVYNYKQGGYHFKAGRLDQAIASFEKALNQPQSNLYELANASYMLGIIYAQKRENPTALFHLNHAFIEDARYLSRQARQTALDLLVQLRGQTGDFLGAREAFAELKKMDPNAGGGAANVAAQVEHALANNAPLVTEVHLARYPLLGPDGVWRHALLRSKFSFAQISGEVRSFHLSCAQTVHDAAVDAEMEWNVPQQAGPCLLRVDGAAGATFKFVEE